jgi:excisionase family DNA binding protein
MELERKSPAKLAYTVWEAQEVSGLSRSLLYEAMKAGELQFIKVRSRRLLLHEDLAAWLKSKRVAV